MKAVRLSQCSGVGRVARGRRRRRDVIIGRDTQGAAEERASLASWSFLCGLCMVRVARLGCKVYEGAVPKSQGGIVMKFVMQITSRYPSAAPPPESRLTLAIAHADTRCWQRE